PLSPYAASKAAGEMYAHAYSEVFDLPIISLRYYNVFGKRQDPDSPYAAVIPIFIFRLLKGEQPVIFGDGEQTRDFVHIDNVIQANIKAATQSKPEDSGRAFNIACGKNISINELYNIIADELNSDIKPIYKPPWPGDVRDSIADISAARRAFGYNPAIDVREGLKRSIEWFKQNVA
ncbi:MAG: NAD-dependent epimerase/dehydratase family protein, partial [Candidatus Latescibacteria bacterium]|nr:NAD-dependent epimerase/dehydratase family protein [Candidatus Latescibacterota bacterium]